MHGIYLNPFTSNHIVKAREEEEEEDPALANEEGVNELKVDDDEPILGTEEFLEEKGQCM